MTSLLLSPQDMYRGVIGVMPIFSTCYPSLIMTTFTVSQQVDRSMHHKSVYCYCKLRTTIAK